MVSEGADRVQSPSHGQLNLDDDGIRAQTINGFHCAGRVVGESDHGHMVTTLLDDIAHELTSIVSPVADHDPHVQVRK